MKRKLKKLLRHPARFFLDSGVFGRSRTSADPLPVPSVVGAEEAAPECSIPELPAVTKAAAVPAPTRAAPTRAAPTRAKPAPRVLQPDRPAGTQGYEHFALHGVNWLEAPDKPVAVLWEFAGWQRDFVAQYLPEYRVAFVNARRPWAKVQADLDNLHGIRFIVRGYFEDPAVREYAAGRGIAIARMDDGFVRSVLPAKDRTVPYSMVLDESGLYSNAAEPSDLERLLCSHDFSGSTTALKSAPALMQLHRQLGISKYNSESFESAAGLLGPKLRRRILVAGEAPTVKPGHVTADAWTARRLVELAVAENPRAEIIFRPHPADAKSYRKGSAGAAELEALCRVLADDVALPELLGTVDHVYVVASLVGMESLIHGVPVTVVGTPFYAGWGLTDDRQELPRRGRQLSLDELYCGAYLLYPRYLADLEDPVTGCLAAMIRVAAERSKRFETAATTEAVVRHAASMALTDHWPTLLRPGNLERLTAKHGKKLFDAFSVGRAFSDSRADRYQRAVAYLLVGRLRTGLGLKELLPRLKTAMRTDAYRQVLAELWRMQPTPEILEQLAWCCEKAGDFDEARVLLEHLAFGGEHKKDPACRLPFASTEYPLILRLAQFELDRKHFDRAEQLFNWLLLSGCIRPEVFFGLASVARLRFDFTSAALLLGISRRLHPAWRLGKAHLQHAQACGLTPDATSALASMAVACLTNPQVLGAVPSIEHGLTRYIGALPYDEAMVLAMELGAPDNIIGRAKGLIAHERHADAERLLLGHSPQPADAIRHGLTLSMAYSYQRKLADATALVSSLLTTSPTLAVYEEALRLAVIAGDYEWGHALLAAAHDRGLEINDNFDRLIALGRGEIREAYLKYRTGKAPATLRNYFGDKYVQSLDSLTRERGKTNLVVASFGPGDEIRFTTLYANIRAAGGDSRVAFTCDPRLLGLLSRHYTNLEFVPSARIRFLGRLEHFENHDQLPGSELHNLFDNRGWAEAKAADKVILVQDALGDVLDGYHSFKGRPCLKADPALVQQWLARLPRKARGELLVGLSWRSSLLNFKRNEHYLAVEDLLPFFALEGVRFVNLQYDDCREEVAWLEERFPGRLLHFEDLDQFNDLDGVAALMDCLDLVIAPCTTVVELAGALGRPTLLLSNSSELHWRKIPGTRVDTWHHSILHVEAPVLGDRAGLVRAAATELQARVATARPDVQAIA